MSLSLQTLQTTLGKSLITDTWVSDNDTRGDMVSIYRDYADGNHDANLTAEMKAMLRLSREGTEFSGNYCDMVVQKMNDRLHVEKIDSESDAANAWADELLAANRFDGFQDDIHTSTLEDGDAFIMLEYSEDEGRIILHNEPAWDGVEGVLAVYDRQGRNLRAIIKVWYETDEDGEDIARVNFYTQTEIRKYRGLDTLEMIEEPLAWSLGFIPFVHFKNRQKRRTPFGISELQSVVPLQDAINRTLVSMVMTSELSAFQIKVAKFFQPPTLLTPGMFIEIQPPQGDPEIVNTLISNTSVDVIPQADIVPFIEQVNFLSDQISTISRTPMPRQMGGSNESGEALKQREVDLLGKVRRFQTKAGNAWEDVIELAAKMQAHFGSLSADIVNASWSTVWRDAEMRNETEQINNIMAVRELIGDDAALRKLAPILNIDEQEEQRIIEEKATAQTAAFSTLGNAIPAFSSQAFEPQDTLQPL